MTSKVFYISKNYN